MEKNKARMLERMGEHESHWTDVSLEIWNHPELAMEEHHSSALLADEMEQAGFDVDRGVAGMPTAFVATWGAGSPTIGFLCEFDALPGLSNEAVPEQRPIVEAGPGHGCGHNLIGTGSMGAALAARAFLEQGKLPGTVKLFGTPAEETLAGKVFMTRDGVFDGLDAVLTWHPMWETEATYESCLSLYSIKFAFRGRTCHIPSRPEAGRNALDAVELMNVAANMRRKHLPPGTTLEYVVLQGGDYPNVVPDWAEAWYFVRAPEVEKLRTGVQEIQNAARGAAVATGTEVSWRILTGCYPYLPNRSFAEVLYENFQAVGPPRYSEEEHAFARDLQKTFAAPPGEALDEGLRLTGDFVAPYSQDDGDLSWLCPLGLVHASAWVRGVPAHTWQVVATSGMSIGHKAMMAVAKALAAAAADLFTKPEKLQAIQAEFRERTQGFQYECLVPADVKPLEEQSPPYEFTARSAG